MVEAVAIWLITFIALYLMNPIIKLLRLLHNLMMISSKPKPDDLKKRFGEWAVVTGATDGVGKEYAKELAKRDLNLVLISRSNEKLNDTKDEIQLLNLGILIKVIEADFSRGAYVIEKVRDQLKDIPVGILVNNVGSCCEYPMYLGEISDRNLWDMINVNIGATTLMTHLIIEDMKIRKKGAIVNISSILDTQPCPLMSVYAATKTFIRYFTDAIREEYSQYGLTVQRLSPSYINTKMVTFSPTVKDHRILCPNPATFVKSAISTLGKLDSTSGYWSHEVMKFFWSMIPMFLKKKFIFGFIMVERNGYLQSLKQKITEVQVTLSQ